MFNAAAHSVHELFKTNRSLRHKLGALQLATVPNLAAPSAFVGHDFIMALRRDAQGSWARFPLNLSRSVREAFANLVRLDPPSKQSIPITEIDGLCFSKTTSGRKGEPLTSLAHLAERLYTPGELKHYQPEITFSTDEDFGRNTSSLMKRFRGFFKVDYHAWSDRYYVINEDGSHRMAAVYRQCVEQQRSFILPCEATRWRLSPSVVESLTRDYLGIVTANAGGSGLIRLLRHYGIEPFHESVRWNGDRITLVLIPCATKYAVTLVEWISAMADQGRLVNLNEFLIQRVGGRSTETGKTGHYQRPGQPEPV